VHTFRLKFTIACGALAIFTGTAGAKRVPPRPVAPVILDGVRYTAQGDGRDQYVVAEDASRGNELWKVKVFHNNVKFWIEEDVQWVFISNLKLVNNTLFVRDEKSRCYSIDLKRKHVSKQECGGLFSP
jgi:hypothetical protein